MSVLSALAGVLSLPAAGQASSGGGSGQPSSGGSGLAPGSSAPVRSANQPAPTGNGNALLTVSANGVMFSTRASALLRGRLHVTGNIPSAAGQTVEIERLGRETSDRWAPTTHAQVDSAGNFSAYWHVNHIGRFRIRVVVQAQGASATSSASPTLTVTIYRPAVATFYGPGLYGNRTACGETLGRHTLGVANRTLPCGTPVALEYHGRTMIVPVIDRGPYANGADWDLTMATAKRLGVTTTSTIGAVSLPAGTPSAN
jgi:rare lipoprotein A